MPSAFTTPGFAAPSAALPAISSAAVGIPSPGSQIGNQIGQAAQSYVLDAQQAAQKKLEMDQNKLKLQAAQSDLDNQAKSQAMQQLGFYYRMVMGDQTGTKTKDAQLIQAVNNASQAAGLGSTSLTVTDPVTGATEIDKTALQHLVDSKLLSQADPALQTRMSEANPGAQREGVAAMGGIDPSTMPPEARNAPKYLPPKDVAEVRKEMQGIFSKYAMGNGTISGLTAQLNAMMPDMVSAGMSVGDIQTYLTTTYKDDIAPMAAAKVREMDAAGLSKEAQAAYLKQKTIDEPKDLASKITTRAGHLEIAGQALAEKTRNDRSRVDLAERNATQQQLKTAAYINQVNSNIKTAASKTDMSGLALSLKVADTGQKNLMTQLTNLQREAGQYIANSKDVPDDVLDSITKLQGVIAQNQAAIDLGNATVSNGAGKKFANSVAKPTQLKPANAKDGPDTETVNGKQYKFAGSWDKDGNMLYIPAQ